MDKQTHDWQVIVTALVTGMVIFLLLSWGPVSKRINILEPKDPAKGLRALFIVLIALWVIVGLVVSIGLLLRGMGAN
ncbi:MAG: hypothetical protein OEZ32_03565 [Nitrospinota bacterium]|nr:hypothetical protein [Nitrospinota bacterium]